ncbi:MAG: XTP/dITP diphosphohydrolase [Saprospiraceae bacterium]|jgi:XTP/dITP diphosphohydrolase
MNLSIVFATGNANKVREVLELLGEGISIINLKDIGCEEDIPETQPTIEGNALQKARYVLDNYQQDCFAEDTGLEIDVLNGEPGVFSARYAGAQRDSEANMALVLEKLEGHTNRKAHFKTVIALILNGKEITFEGIVKGYIAEAKKGEKGFGYDSIFIPEGYDISFAQMSSKEKNIISHRGKAVRLLINYLEGLVSQ